METTFSTAFSTSPLAPGGSGGQTHPHHLFSTNSLHLQVDSNNSGGGGLGAGSANGGGGGGMLMMMGGNESGGVSAFTSGLGGARRLVDPSSTSMGSAGGVGGNSGGGFMWGTTNGGNPGNNSGSTPLSRFQLSTTFDADPFSDKFFDPLNRAFTGMTNNDLQSVFGHDAVGGGGNSANGGGGGNAGNHLHQLQQPSSLPSHGGHQNRFFSPPSPPSSHSSVAQGLTSANYSLSPTGSGAWGNNSNAGVSATPPALPAALHPQHLLGLVDPQNPEESAMRLNEGIKKCSSALLQWLLTQPPGSPMLDPKAFLKGTYALLASRMTTPAHLAIVARLEECHRKEIRGLVLQSCMSKLGSASEEEAVGAGDANAGAVVDGETIPQAAKLLVEMAKLHLVRLSGVIVVVYSFLEKPSSRRVGLAVLGLMMDQLKHNERFLASVRANQDITVQLFQLHRIPEFEYDVLAITQFLLSPSPSSRRRIENGGEEGNGSNSSGLRSRAVEQNNTTLLYEGPVLMHKIPAGPLAAAHLSSLQQRSGQQMPLMNVPTTRMVYIAHQDEIMTAHVNGTVVLWGDPGEKKKRQKSGEERQREGSDARHEKGVEEDENAEDRRNGADDDSEVEEEEEADDEQAREEERSVGGRRREWTTSKGMLEMPNDCVAWAMAGPRSGRYLVLAGHPHLPKSPYSQFFQYRRSTPPTVVNTATAPRQPVLFVLGFSDAKQQWTSVRVIYRPQSAVVTALTALSPAAMCFAESRMGGTLLRAASESTDGSDDGSAGGNQLVLMDPIGAQTLRVLPHVHTDYTTVLTAADTITSSDHALYSGSRDKTVKLYDIRSHDPIAATMVAHEDTISAIALHQHLVLTTSLDGMLFVWDNRQLSEPFSNRTFSSPVLDLAFLKAGSGSSSVVSNYSTGSGANGVLSGGNSNSSDHPQLAVATTRALYLVDMSPMVATDIIPNRCFTQLAANNDGSVLFATDTEGVHTFAVKRGMN